MQKATKLYEKKIVQKKRERETTMDDVKDVVLKYETFNNVPMPDESMTIKCKEQ